MKKQIKNIQIQNNVPSIDNQIIDLTGRILKIEDVLKADQLLKEYANQELDKNQYFISPENWNRLTAKQKEILMKYKVKPNDRFPI